MRVVADTNVIISMLLWGKSLERLLVLANTRQIILCFSPQTIDELFRVIRYPHIQKQAQKLQSPLETLLDKLLAASLLAHPTQRIAAISQDPSDNRILEIALAAQAACIISGNKHLLNLKQIQNIPILAPQEFLKQY